METEIRIALPKELRVLYGVLLVCVLGFFGYHTLKGGRGTEGWMFLLVFAAVFFVGADYYFRVYTFRRDGVQVRWFFHTAFYPWEEFQDIFRFEYRGNREAYGYLCLDRGIPHRLAPRLDRDLHWFRFILVELTDAQRPGAWKWCADREEVLRFLRDLGIEASEKPYRGLFT